MTVFENKTKRPAHVSVTMPSGRKVRVTLPVGKFELSNSYILALDAHPYGAKLLKRFKIKPPKVKPDAPKVETEDKQEGSGGV